MPGDETGRGDRDSRRTCGLTPVALVGSGPAVAAQAHALGDAGYPVITVPHVRQLRDLAASGNLGVVIVEVECLAPGAIEMVRRCVAAAGGLLIGVSTAAGADRRAVRRRLGLFALHDSRDGMERFLELVDAAVDVGRDQHRRRLEHAVRVTMLAKLCHDLRSSLHVIHGYADMLGDEPSVEAPARGALSGLRKASRQSCELLETYAALAHCESERMELRREMVDVRAAVAALRRHVAIRSRYSPCALLADAPPRLAVETDPEKLHAMLTHLIDAAIKRSDDGTVGLRVATLADQVLFDVSTTALDATAEADPAALDPSAADQLFETPGQILALTIAHRFGQLLGATVEAQAVGSGLTFRVALPRRAAAPGAGATVH